LETWACPNSAVLSTLLPKNPPMPDPCKKPAKEALVEAVNVAETLRYQKR